jgi:hypothetical protein
MIVMKNYMHYCRNTTILEKHISLNISMDRPANSFLDIKKSWPSLLAIKNFHVLYWLWLKFLFPIGHYYPFYGLTVLNQWRKDRFALGYKFT